MSSEIIYVTAVSLHLDLEQKRLEMICISSNYFIVFVFTDSIQSWFIGVFKDCGLPQVFSILVFVTPVSIVADPNRTLVKKYL